MNVFVYGTLMRNQRNHFLLKDAKFISTGYILGTLYHIKGQDYPAFVAKNKRMIVGEVYEIDEEMLIQLDELEEYFGENHPDNLYNRVIVDVYDDNQNVLCKAYVYEYVVRDIEELVINTSNKF